MARPLLILLCFCLAAAPAWSRMRPVPKIRIGTPPVVIIKDILRSNLAGAGTPASNPLITWVADCDERISVNTIFKESAGKVYQIRNAGNQIITAVPAVDYGVLRLYTPVLLITGNTGNRFIHQMVTGNPQPDLETRRLLDHLLPARQGTETDSPQQLRTVIEKNVDYQVGLAVQRYGNRIKKGRLAVVGAIIDLENSYGFGAGRLVITNLNGETDPDKLRRSPLLTTLGRDFARVIGRPEQPAQRQPPQKPSAPAAPAARQ